MGCSSRERGAVAFRVTLAATGGVVLFKVYARFIPNRTRRDGSALLARMADTTPAKSDTGNLRAGEQRAQ